MTNKLRKIFLLVLIAIVASLRLAGCGGKNEHPTDEPPSTEHPSEEKPSEEHPSEEKPSEEHPSEEKPSAEHPAGEHPK